MKWREQKKTKHNPEMVDRLFGVMFETLWLPVYDSRCRDAAYVEFGRCARRAVLLLSTTDLQRSDEEQLATLRFALQEVARSIERIDASGRFAPVHYRAARQIVAQIIREVELTAEAVPVGE